MPGPENLDAKEWRNLKALADTLALASALEEAWKKGPPPELAQFLPPVGSPARSSILRELVKTDLGCRWRLGQGVLLEEYLLKFPDELGPAHSIPADLVVEEYRVRHLHGDRPALAEMQTRFPAQFPVIQKLLQPDLLSDLSHRPGSALTSTSDLGLPPESSILSQIAVQSAKESGGNKLADKPAESTPMFPVLLDSPVPTPAAPPSSFLGSAFALVGIVGFLVTLAWIILDPGSAPGVSDGDFLLEPVPLLHVHPGDTVHFDVAIKRDRFPGAVALTFSDTHEVEIKQVSIPPGAMSTQVSLNVAKQAKPGPRKLTVQACGAARCAYLQVDLEIEGLK